MPYRVQELLKNDSYTYLGHDIMKHDFILNAVHDSNIKLRSAVSNLYLQFQKLTMPERGLLHCSSVPSSHQQYLTTEMMLQDHVGA